MHIRTAKDINFIGYTGSIYEHINTLTLIHVEVIELRNNAPVIRM